MIYQLSTFKGINNWYVICNNLVGKGHHGYWNYPAIIMEISLKDFIKRLVVDWNATLDIHYNKEDNSISWIGYSWKSEKEANKFKNAINLLARQKNITI